MSTSETQRTDGLVEALKAAIGEAEQLTRAAANPAANAPRHAVDQFATDDELAFDAHFTPQLLESFLAAHREILGLCQMWIAIDELPVGASEGRDQDEIARDSAIAVNARQLLAALAKGYGIEADQ